MKLVMTVVVRDEEDVIDAQIAYHLHAGVDFVIATDNRSQDRTTEILERYERAGCLRLIRERSDDMRQDVWVTSMARLAATEYGADWVLNADADEFWWPRGGSLKEVLATIPRRYGVVRGFWRHFVPRPDDGSSFHERMTARLVVPAHPGDKTTIFHAHQKVAHRATPEVVIEFGNHNADGPGLVPLRTWHPIEVLHFSLRSVSQLERKASGGWVRNTDYEPALHQVLLDKAFREGRLEAYFESLVTDDEALEQGLANGTLAVDTRLREALRTLSDGDGSFALPGDERRLEFSRLDVSDDPHYASEVSVLAGIDAIVKSETRVDRIEERLSALERGPLAGVLNSRRRRVRGSTWTDSLR